MTVNAGQSELLANFVCNARSKNLDISTLLVFPTDLQAKAVAESLSVDTYYDEKNFGSLPSGEAKQYGDPIFASVMYAKIVCVVYVVLLGYDVLYQDVDVIWYKDPVEYLREDLALQKFDVLFQHDGSSMSRFLPYMANSGLYYVRQNKKTRYLFTSLLYHGALVRQTKSHQQVLVQLLSEHSSLFGLKIKVFDVAETDIFPGGYHFHKDWDTMHKIVEGTSNAYAFHMCWTENKTNKLLFLRQLGEWFVKDECISSGDDVMSSSLNNCCAKEALVTCHFRDKPSKFPCVDSPTMDKNGKLFWK